MTKPKKNPTGRPMPLDVKLRKAAQQAFERRAGGAGHYSQWSVRESVQRAFLRASSNALWVYDLPTGTLAVLAPNDAFKIIENAADYNTWRIAQAEKEYTNV